MKALTCNTYVRWAVRGFSLLVAVAVVWGLGFLQGRAYAKRKAAVEEANAACFYCLVALTGMNEAADRPSSRGLLDGVLDTSSARLADMSLKYPKLIERTHYNLLVRVRDYRKKYGRLTSVDQGLPPAEVDRKVSGAISYLQSVHGTNNWFASKQEAEFYEIFRELEKAGAVSRR